MVDLAERRLSLVFAALSDPGRRWIVKRLAQAAPLSPSDFTRHLHMSLQGVTKHIAILERAGIIRREKRGRRRLLFLELTTLRAAGAWIELYRSAGEHLPAAAHAGHSSPVHPHAHPPVSPRATHPGGR
ncbi:MAG: helix-turn-helix transcriptional regulator [Planctomycetes bacterium]|nr:helix-turn-helix transcriptional regulator [Planctomycetota bacterium]